MITQEEFEAKIADFDALEPTRSPLYERARLLLENGYEVEAYLLILATWNFANFRYILTTFDLKRFLKVIESTAPMFERLKKSNFKEARLEELADDIKGLYSQFKDLVGQTGASKIIHFKHPDLFVMWDTQIRRKFKIPNKATDDHYLGFLKKMKEEYGHIDWNRTDKTFPKAIDEFNFVSVHEQGKLRRKRKKL